MDRDSTHGGLPLPEHVRRGEPVEVPPPPPPPAPPELAPESSRRGPRKRVIAAGLAGAVAVIHVLAPEAPAEAIGAVLDWAASLLGI